jgi:predicted  nucleic acid-binding Zn-ribbon protein
MSAALRLYEQLTEAKDDKTRARLIAEAFDELEARFPQLADLATQGHVREGELRIQKEIEVVRKEIEVVRREIKEIEARLHTEIKSLEVRLTQAIHRQTLWLVGAVGAIVGLIRLLDVVIK